MKFTFNLSPGIVSVIRQMAEERGLSFTAALVLVIDAGLDQFYHEQPVSG